MCLESLFMQLARLCSIVAISYHRTYLISYLRDKTAPAPHWRDSVQLADSAQHSIQTRSGTAKDRSDSAIQSAGAAAADTPATGWFQLCPSMKWSRGPLSLHTECYAQSSGGLTLAEEHEPGQTFPAREDSSCARNASCCTCDVQKMNMQVYFGSRSYGI